MFDDHFNNEEVEFMGKRRSTMYTLFRSFKSSLRSSNQTSSQFIQLILKFGIAKNEQQALYMLLGLIVFLFIVALYILFFRGGAYITSDKRLLPSELDDFFHVYKK